MNIHVGTLSRQFCRHSHNIPQNVLFGCAFLRIVCQMGSRMFHFFIVLKRLDNRFPIRQLAPCLLGCFLLFVTRYCAREHRRSAGGKDARSSIVQTGVDGGRCNVDARAKNRNNGIVETPGRAGSRKRKTKKQGRLEVKRTRRNRVDENGSP